MFRTFTGKLLTAASSTLSSLCIRSVLGIQLKKSGRIPNGVSVSAVGGTSIVDISYLHDVVQIDAVEEVGYEVGRARR